MIVSLDQIQFLNPQESIQQTVASNQNVHMHWCSPWLFEYALNYIQIFTCSRMDNHCDDKGNVPYEKNNLIILLG